ncbi:MAG: efflux RND transporter periplasmic adaptor subunit [Bacteroidetes bacterium]|jgi:HlyD family secretion protein|nr:efflux RND transporter periplasmic adaptor subunit [Bacteroidota bacterium]
MLRKNRKLLWILAAVVLLTVLAAMGKRMGWWGQTPPLEVAVEKVALRDLTETVLASGKIQPVTEVKISSEVSGEIVALTIKEGDAVRKGQLLARINPEMMAAALDRNEAAVNNAKSGLASARVRLRQLENLLRINLEPAYRRTARLFEDKVATQAELEVARSQYESALQDIESAKEAVEGAVFMVQSARASQKEMKEQLARTNILSPMDGIVTKLSVELGERVVGTIQMAGTEMIRIADLTRMEVRVDVSESDVVRVKNGDSVMVEVDAYPGQKFSGMVREIANSSNSSALPGTGGADQVTNFLVKISLLGDNRATGDRSGVDKAANAESMVQRFLFRPGMSASAEITTRRVQGAVSVPINAVAVRDAEGQATDPESEESSTTKNPDQQNTNNEQIDEVVFVRSGNKALLRKVTTGIQDDKHIQILSGLRSGEEVVTAPYSAVSRDLRNNRVIKVVGRDQLFSGEE